MKYIFFILLISLMLPACRVLKNKHSTLNTKTEKIVTDSLGVSKKNDTETSKTDWNREIFIFTPDSATLAKIIGENKDKGYKNIPGTPVIHIKEKGVNTTEKKKETYDSSKFVQKKDIAAVKKDITKQKESKPDRTYLTLAIIFVAIILIGIILFKTLRK